MNRGLGYVSWGHCKDALLVGWSRNKIGVDIERNDRFFEARQVVERFFCDEEKSYYCSLNENDLRLATLKSWVLKEASIKLQNGSLAKDLSKWTVKENHKCTKHKYLNLELATDFIEHSSWYIAIAQEANSKNTKLCLI